MEEKDFDTWNQKQKKLDRQKNYQHPKEGEIWWCSIGMNIGSEVYGKGTNYTRPVLVVNSSEGAGFIGIPLSSRLKSRKYSCVISSSDGRKHAALVYQIRNFDKRRLVDLASSISPEEYMKVKKVFEKNLSNMNALQTQGIRPFGRGETSSIKESYQDNFFLSRKNGGLLDKKFIVPGCSPKPNVIQ